MDTTQLLLSIVLTIAAVFLVIIGIQLVFVLKELRQALANANKIIQGFEAIGSGLDHGLSEIIGFINGFKSITKIIDSITHHKNEKSA